MRYHTITQKLPGGEAGTGLNGSLFIHADFNADWSLEEIRISEKGKDGSTLDTVLTAVGDAITQIIQDHPEKL
tara:strand:+ start:358 stop:576 length:219 start_codon:yes stop_codon:yes gene_type:complete